MADYNELSRAAGVEVIEDDEESGDGGRWRKGITYG